MNVAHRRGKNHENYTSWRFMWQWLHLCILISYDSCIYLVTKIHNELSKKYVQLNHIYRVSQEECEILRESVPYVKLYRYNPKHLCPKLNGYGDNGQRKVWHLAFPRTVRLQLCSALTLTEQCSMHLCDGTSSAQRDKIVFHYSRYSCAMYSAWQP